MLLKGIFTRNILISILVSIFSALLSTSCIFMDKTRPESKLTERITHYYDNLKDKNILKCRDMIIESEKSYGEIDNKELEKLPTIKTYEILSMERTCNEVKVRMRVYTSENGEVTTDEHYDFWVYENKNWYLRDFGRTFGMEGAVKEYIFDPEKFK